MDDHMTHLANFLVRELDAATRDVARARTLPMMAAKAEGRADGILSALAYIGGLEGYKRTDQLIAKVRAGLPHPVLVTPEPATLDRCTAELYYRRCTRIAQHPGQHIGDLGAPWSDPAPDDSPTLQRAMDGDR